MLALTADGLTGLRALLAIPLFWATAVENYPVAAGLLAVAWWSDFLDGRMARRATTPTKLGAWDPLCDALIGTALLGGLLSSGVVGVVPWGLIGLVLLVAFISWRNLSLGMLLQALAYAFFLANVWTAEPGWMVVLAGTIALILIFDWRRFTTEVLPTFFAGISGGRETDQPAEAE